jgi:hypothetical protein
MLPPEAVPTVEHHLENTSIFLKLFCVSVCLFSARPALACEYPDEGNLPLRRAVTKVRLLPEIEAWSAAARKAGAAVQYALLLEQTLHSGGRCYWTIEVRADGETWRTFHVSPDGKKLLRK